MTASAWGLATVEFPATERRGAPLNHLALAFHPEVTQQVDAFQFGFNRHSVGLRLMDGGVVLDLIDPVGIAEFPRQDDFVFTRTQHAGDRSFFKAAVQVIADGRCAQRHAVDGDALLLRPLYNKEDLSSGTLTAAEGKFPARWAGFSPP